mmetsp:Transcript_61943/g.147770  ORF Transcript_61943/g.147770 Transcript_61943/m.147770 type:complete len:430 (-) Transcript_61943:40-1329(-)|eukprot:CAMPEP_0178451098 /NCGR_PEP_ID=MMETSP0689_2-20121128/43490_1 /TAXON_ID=160604 /ORGANISM="Amphidinium massartii, Strain CS-259" /LENGTH=429 /DNA_ID=CAMNT_0020076635 /DNA_START=28 /DNA_END=1317 /DNA_ORIENTATION=+
MSSDGHSADSPAQERHGGLTQQHPEFRRQVVELLRTATGFMASAMNTDSTSSSSSSSIIEGIHFESLVQARAALEDLNRLLMKVAPGSRPADEQQHFGSPSWEALCKEVESCREALCELCKAVMSPGWIPTEHSSRLVLKAMQVCQELEEDIDSFINESVATLSTADYEELTTAHTAEAAFFYRMSSAGASTTANSSMATSLGYTSSTTSGRSAHLASRRRRIASPAPVQPEAVIADVHRYWQTKVAADELRSLRTLLSPLAEADDSSRNDCQVLIIGSSESAMLFSMVNAVVREAVSALRRWYKKRPEATLEELSNGLLNVLARSPGRNLGMQALEEFLATGDVYWAGDQKWENIKEQVLKMAGEPKGLFVFCKNIILLAGAGVGDIASPFAGKSRNIANALASADASLRFTLLSSENGKLSLWKTDA